MHLLLCLIFFAWIRDGNTSAPHQRMVGAVKASGGRWRFIAYLNFHQREPLWKTCGAAIIAPRFAITAAHCVEDIVEHPRFVTVGVHQMTRRVSHAPHENITVSKIYVPDKFVLPAQRKNNEASLDYDIALLKLSKEVTGDRIPVALPAANDDINSRAGKVCLAAGWGKTTKFTSKQKYMNQVYEVAKRLREIQVPIVDKKVCIKKKKLANDPYFGNNLEHILCGGVLGRDKAKSTPCFGDSGSPLVCTADDGTDVLQGILVSGPVFCIPGLDYIYFSQVAKYREWIDSKIRD